MQRLKTVQKCLIIKTLCNCKHMQLEQSGIITDCTVSPLSVNAPRAYSSWNPASLSKRHYLHKPDEDNFNAATSHTVTPKQRKYRYSTLWEHSKRTDGMLSKCTISVLPLLRCDSKL